MGFNCGIVGLPNVGKSTLFNALTQTAAAEAMNYPFCTIEPNVGKVGVPDHRLEKLADIAGSEKIIPTQIEVVDIAGLVKGASQGEGLGNQFLGHIRSTDAILHMVRCFNNNDISHVHGTVDPVRDIEVIETELILADIESLRKREKNIAKRPDAAKEKKVIGSVLEHLEQGKLVRNIEITTEDTSLLHDLNLLTSKPSLYICNVSEDELNNGNKFSAQVQEHMGENNCVIVSAAIESEIALIKDDMEKQEFIESLGLSESGLARIIRGGYNLLQLLTFFTIGPKEAHAWTTHQGSTAPVAASKIHTDFEKGFICAETISYDDYINYNGESGAKAAGKMRLEGREYKVIDGDIFHFRFNV